MHFSHMAFEFAARNPTWHPSRHPGSGKESSIAPSRATEVQHGPHWHPSRPRDTYHGARVGQLGPSWGGLGAVLGRSWAVLGRLVGKVKMRSSFSGKDDPVLCFHRAQNSEADEVDEADEPETVSATAAPTPPCHRAGGKDYGSFKTNSLKLVSTIGG